MNRAGTAIIVLSLGIALLLGACKAGPDFHAPAAPAQERYVPAEATPVNAPDQQRIELGAQLSKDWWQLFHSEPLDRIVRRSLAGNRTLKQAAATLAQASELAAAQAGTRYPQVGVVGATGAQKYGAEFLGSQFKVPAFGYFAIGATVSYALDYTGGVARSVEEQYARAEYQHQQLDAAYLSVTGNAVLQALRIAWLKEQVATVEAILAEDRTNQDLVRTAYEAGSVARVDTLSAESQLASDETLLPPLRQQLDLAQHALAVVLGQGPAQPMPAELDLASVVLPQTLPVSLPSELVRHRPDILASEAQLHAATAAVGVADANLYPHITLTASGGQQATSLRQLFDGASTAWSVGGSLVAPVFDGGTLRAQKRAAMDALQARTADYEQTVLVAFGQVADALQALQHDSEELQAQAHAQQAAGENVDLTRRSYNEGNVGVLQVLDAERLYQNARLGYVRARGQRYLDTAQLLLALGGSAP